MLEWAQFWQYVKLILEQLKMYVIQLILCQFPKNHSLTMQLRRVIAL